ncbi:MAG: hypothetical protein C4547_14540 [Phycisphaerales bacterium]|nr:MAG: hypothetical protein C4547_14540 [Phycisphaerales bacterium]
MCVIAAPVTAAALLSGIGCTPVSPLPTEDDGGSSSGRAVVDAVRAASQIINFRQSVPVSGRDEVTLLYTISPAADSARAYYVRVASTLPGAEEVGPRVTFASDLPLGENQPVTLNTAGLEPGAYRLGIIVEVRGETLDLTTEGVLVVHAPPRPVFRGPLEDLRVEPGASIPIVFEIERTSQETIHWQAFHRPASGVDRDGDGVDDIDDDCPGTGAEERMLADVNGCSPVQQSLGTEATGQRDDFDRDGIANAQDLCPQTSEAAAVDAAGCAEDQRGTEIAVGEGSVGHVDWHTNGLPQGTYRFGVSATDTGRSIAQTMADGKSSRIITVFARTVVTIGEDRPPGSPELVFTRPAADETAFMVETIPVEFRVTGLDPRAPGRLVLFLDDDTQPDDGDEWTVADDVDPATGAYDIPTADLVEGVYQVGATLVTDGRPPVTVYAPGRVTVVRTPVLTVTAPDTDFPVCPGVEVEVAWSTNVPPGAGRVDVYYRRLDASGRPTGEATAILERASTEVTTAVFVEQDSGLYQIAVRVSIDRGGVDNLESTAPRPVRITSLPAVLWVGALATEDPMFDGAVFEGVNFEDNAGGALAAAGDLNDDGFGEFVIAARYGKPFFINPAGVGPGEAYVIYGSARRWSGAINLNSVGTSLLTGVTMTGVRTPNGNHDTDGLTAVTALPDVDGDAKPELMFGFPNTDSRGHNASPRQDGVVPPWQLTTLEREQQFLRGGIVIVSSRNGALGAPEGRDAVINLDLVGQNFGDINDLFAGFEAQAFSDIYTFDPQTGACVGTCNEPMPDGVLDSVTRLAAGSGFCDTLAVDILWDKVPNREVLGEWGGMECLQCFPEGDFCFERTVCAPSSPVLNGGAGFSGFYPQGFDVLEPLGARIIGIGMGDAFGTSATLSFLTDDVRDPGDLIVSAPNRTARGLRCCGGAEGTEVGPEITGLADGIRPDAGVAYLFPLRSLWTPDAEGRVPPRPHQYQVGQASHCDSLFDRIDNVDALRIAGFEDDRITQIIGIRDFNGDGRNDFAIGAPDAAGGAGRVYVAFRRARSIEEDYVLEKLALDPNDPERLAGVLIRANEPERFGFSLATGVDFNGDGLADLVIGSPDADRGVGAVTVVFSDPHLVSPRDGLSLDALIATGRAARITGNVLDAEGRFGFNVANAGDVNGDGADDLVIAAPGATPRFDPDPTDPVDLMTEPGLDLDFDGVRDDLASELDLPDFDNRMTQAGLVYVLLGSTDKLNRLDLLGGERSISIATLGSRLHGFLVAGRRAEDFLGGGDAGDARIGGIDAKAGRGRSFGVASAGDVDGDRKADLLIGAILADPRRDRFNAVGIRNAGETYLIYSGSLPPL